MKYLALDLGNILCTVDFKPLTNMFIKHGFWNFNFDLTYSFCEDFQHSMDIGFTNIKSEVKKYTKYDKEEVLEDFKQAWVDCVKPVNQMFDILNGLHNTEIAILSNIGTDHSSHAIEKFPEEINRYVHHFSCDVGIRKPHKLFFQSFLLDNPEFKNCLFIDDRHENLQAASKCDFETAHFDVTHHDTHKKATAAFKKILVDNGYFLF